MPPDDASFREVACVAQATNAAHVHLNVSPDLNGSHELFIESGDRQ
jgi:hypothetical protein